MSIPDYLQKRAEEFKAEFTADDYGTMHAKRIEVLQFHRASLLGLLEEVRGIIWDSMKNPLEHEVGEYNQALLDLLPSLTLEDKETK